jgi:hypothetical protein
MPTSRRIFKVQEQPGTVEHTRVPDAYFGKQERVISGVKSVSYQASRACHIRRQERVISGVKSVSYQASNL